MHRWSVRDRRRRSSAAGPAWCRRARGSDRGAGRSRRHVERDCVHRTGAGWPAAPCSSRPVNRSSRICWCGLAASSTRRARSERGSTRPTHLPGLFVAGDASRAVQWVVVAAAEGAEAAFAINTDLLKEDLAVGGVTPFSPLAVTRHWTGPIQHGPCTHPKFAHLCRSHSAIGPGLRQSFRADSLLFTEGA